MNKIYIFLLLISFTFALKETIMNFRNEVSVKMTLLSDDLMKFTITVPKSNKWVILGFGNETRKADFFLVESQTNLTTITDMKFNSERHAILDTYNNYILKAEVKAETKIYSVTRNLNTQDSSDYTIKDGTNSIFIAFGSDSTPEFLEDLVYEHFKLEVTTSNRNLDSDDDSDDSGDSALLHGLFTYIAWNWFSLILIISGRYSKYFYSFRIYLHGVVGVLALVFNLIGVAYSDIDDYDSQNFIGDAHEGISGIISWWAGAMCVIGLFSKICSYFIRHKSYLTTWSRLIHNILSWILIVYAQFAMLSGLYLYNSPVVLLFYLHVAFMIIMGVAFEATFCILFKNWKYEYINQLHYKNLPEMSIAEFLESDKKLALFDNYVIDMGGYCVEHPGTKYVLDECVKMDVGKFFFGSDSMENNVKPFRHSYIAGKVMMKLVVARLVQPKENAIAFKSVKGDINDESMNREGVKGDYEGKDPTPSIYESSMVFGVVSQVEHIKMVYHVGFGNSKTLVKMFFPGTEMLGRHYIINSMQNEICRYYTICNVMHTRVFPQYLSCFDSVLE